MAISFMLYIFSKPRPLPIPWYATDEKALLSEIIFIPASIDGLITSSTKFDLLAENKSASVKGSTSYS